MKLSEVKSRQLKIVGMDSDSYKTPFPVENMPLDLNILIKERLHAAPVKKIPLSSLIAIQSTVSKRGVNGYKKSQGEPALVANINGKNFLMDGTHRATAAWAQHATEIDAKYLKFTNLNMKGTDRLNLQELNALLDKAQE